MTLAEYQTELRRILERNRKNPFNTLQALQEQIDSARSGLHHGTAEYHIDAAARYATELWSILGDLLPSEKHKWDKEDEHDPIDDL